MTRMVRWIDKNIDVESKIIDLGCGNGLMSIELNEVAGHFNPGLFNTLKIKTMNFLTMKIATMKITTMNCLIPDF